MTMKDLLDNMAECAQVRITNENGDTFFHGKCRSLYETGSWWMDYTVQFMTVYQNTLEILIDEEDE